MSKPFRPLRPVSLWLHQAGADQTAEAIDALAVQDATRRRLERQLGQPAESQPLAMRPAPGGPMGPLPNDRLGGRPFALGPADDRRWRADPVTAPLVGAMAGAHGGLVRHAHWPADRDPPAASIVLLPGRNEALEKYHHRVAGWRQQGVEVFAIDWQGQGLSSRYNQDRELGDIASYDDHLADLRQWLRTEVQPRAKGPLVLQAHSMGGHVGLRLLAEDPRASAGFRAAVVSAPLLDLYSPPLVPRWGLRLVVRLHAALGRERDYGPFVGPWKPTAFDGNDLNSDAAGFQRTQDLYAAQPDIRLGGPSNRWLLATMDSCDRMAGRGYYRGITVPTLLISADGDKVVDPAAHRRAVADSAGALTLARLGAPARHDLPHESPAVQQQVATLTERFLARHGIALPVPVVDPSNARRSGATPAPGTGLR